MKLFLSILFLILLLTSLSYAGSPYVGSFSRMGFNARGMGMGNGLVAVTSGDISTYYNPALAPFAQKSTLAAGFGLLSLDRNLNFFSFTQPIHPNGGFSIGLINAGVRNIDSRNKAGVHVEDISTFENQFFLAFGVRPVEELSIGVAVKLYYSKLYAEVTSSTVGFDLGATFKVLPELTIGGAIQDLNSKYKWNTSSVLGLNGRNPTDKFPTVKKIGAAYEWNEQKLLFSLAYENTTASTDLIQGGVEYRIHENITVRSGVDRWEINDDATGAKPSFGFTAEKSFDNWTPALTYAYVFEPFSAHDIHVITLSTTF